MNNLIKYAKQKKINTTQSKYMKIFIKGILSKIYADDFVNPHLQTSQ